MLGAGLFVVFVLTATTCTAREYNCTMDESLCTGSGKQTIFISGVRMCCPITATFTLNGNICKCVEPDVKVPGEKACLQDVALCREASSFITDSQGRLRCCMPGYSLNSITNSYVNGVLLDICTCTPSGSGGFISTFLGTGGGAVRKSVVMSSSFPGRSVVSSVKMGPQGNAMREKWQKMGQRWRDFGRRMHDWGRNFGQRMLNFGRTLFGDLHSTLTRNMSPLRRVLDDALVNLFRPVPGPRNGERVNAPSPAPASPVKKPLSP